ncbi:unnamed protein product [Spirodela intermedia]|uniref:Uncharacterized protein n=1 Tax=Spirodela intermedia TaxID=51605 RepID=A0ABN7ECT6_SPIIN|nr:unnamed protein product [Spirodela intermedia]
MLKCKSEAFGQFKKFKALAEVEKNMKLKCLHSNRENAKGDIVKHKDPCHGGAYVNLVVVIVNHRKFKKNFIKN